MTLLLLTLLLVGPWVSIRLWRIGAGGSPKPAAFYLGISLMFVVTGLSHFTSTEQMAQMLPAWVPARRYLVYGTGALELCGAVGMWVPRIRKTTGGLLIILLVCLLPANFYAAGARVDFGGHSAGPAYLLLRVPF